MRRFYRKFAESQGVCIVKNIVLSALLMWPLFCSCAAGGDGETTPDIQAAVEEVTAHYQNLDKELSIVHDYAYIVKSETGGCVVFYNLEEARMLDRGVYQIPFTVVKGTDNAAGTLIFTPEENSTGVLLSFDDYYPSWDEYFYIFDRYNLPCTFFVTMLREGAKEFSVMAQDKGYEIGWHTVHHYRLDQLDRTAFDYETLGGLGLLTGGTDLDVRNIAYPYGAYREWMNEALGAAFKFIRGYDKYFHVFTVKELAGGFIPSKSIDFNKYNSSEAFRKDIRNMFMTIKFLGDGFVIPLTTHTIHPADTGWCIRPDDLDYLLKTGQDLKLRFYRYNDF
jgi:peptidoglycan/xylan/chitin deacetylase (PgdA/CDA1 family)